MPSGSADLNTLISDVGFQNELAQIRAKSVLKQLVGDIPEYRWTYIGPRLVRNLAAAVLSIQRSVTESAPNGSMGAAARSVAQAWEALSRVEEHTNRTSALIASAFAYEIAGYQANAACIARHLVGRPTELEQPSFVEFVAIFMQRLFVLARRMATDLAKPPQETDSDNEVLYKAAVALTATALSKASHFFLSGETQETPTTITLLRDAEHGFSALGYYREATVASYLQTLVPIMWSRSTWRALSSIFEPPSTIWTRYLKLLARGLGASVLRSGSISELWPSQLEAIRHGLLAGGNKVIQMPTSAGKTRIAELAIVHALAGRNKKAVYIAPYRALVGELEQQFLSLFSDLGFRVSSLMGSFESDPFQDLLASDADLLVLTPEKLDLVQRLHPEFLDSVAVVVIDEGHIVQDQSRGTKIELLLSRLRRRLTNARFLFVSAVVPPETLEELADWLQAGPDSIVRSTWRAPIQRYAAFVWRGTTGTLTYSPTEDIETLRNAFVPGVIKQETFEFRNLSTGRINRRKFPELGNKSQIAAELAFKFADLGPALVFCIQPSFVESVGKALLDRLEYMRASERTIPGAFNTENTRAATVAREWLGRDHQITKCLENGIALHHGNLPEGIRKAVEADFHEQRFKVIAATNTLAQGVNLPLRTVIFHSCWRTDSEGNRVRLPAMDYWNIAGRAGRARFETEGTIVHIVLNETDQRDVAYYLRMRQTPEAVEGALMRLLRALAEQRLTQEALSERLDSDVLALLVEEGGRDLTRISDVEEFIASTLAAVQAKRRGFPTQPLSRAISQVATDIVSRVSDPSLRKVYSSTGLSSTSGEAIRSFVLENRQESEFCLIGASSDNSQFSSLLLRCCMQLREMQPGREFAGNYLDLLNLWLAGIGMGDLQRQFSSESQDAGDLPKFIEDLFGYRLPWGTSAFTKIASHILQIPPERTTSVVKFMPSMIKFGVPTPEAAWAMSIGIPTRAAAISVAADFVSSDTDRSYGGFLNWISELSVQHLSEAYGLIGSVLQDVTRAVMTSSRNPLAFSPIETTLPTEVGMRTVRPLSTWHALGLQPRASLTLLRDYDSLLDRNSVIALFHGEVVGYLPRAISQLLAPEMDTGRVFDCSVTQTYDSTGLVIARISLPPDDSSLPGPSSSSAAD